MLTEHPNPAQQDEQAVTAVKRGDADRFRELVERYERRVYAVAWSRLGDATLAEEATQEAFIRGYRYLWLLGEGEKFGAWIISIARNVAINLGIRHRRELNKRERWALEQTGAEEAGAADDRLDQTFLGKLRATLAQLPDPQRECLVLFYFEGKSGTEAAAALGISEAAFRVRLHRARAALRDRLEERLGESLKQLRPAKSAVPSVMGAILASPSAKTAGAGMGAKALSFLAKVLPFQSFWFLIPVAPLLPSFLIGWQILRLDQRNYRDPTGFRVRWHREFVKKRLPWIAAFFISMALFLPRLVAHLTEIESFYLALGFVLLPVSIASVRRLLINRNRYYITTFLSGVMLTSGLLAIGLGFAPLSAWQLFMLAYIILIAVGYGARPLRMDYNLFLRAAKGMLKADVSKTLSGETGIQLDRTALRSFARFLGAHWLVLDYRWGRHDLALILPPVKPSFGGSMARSVRSFWKSDSQIVLDVDGTVSARLGDRDERDLSPDAPNPLHLKNLVATAVESAWRSFRSADMASAIRTLGQVPETDLFVVPTTRSKATRFVVWYMTGTAVLLLPLTILLWVKPPWLEGMKPVNVTEAEVRAFLGGITTNPNPIVNNTQLSYAGDPTIALSWCLVLPPTNLFTASSLHAVQEELGVRTSFYANQEKHGRLYSLRSNWRVHKAMENGWIGWDDLDLRRQDATEYFQQLKTNEWQFALGRIEAWSWVKSQRFTVERINDYTLNQLRWLRDVNCLDMVDRKELIQQIASVQTLSGIPPGQPPIHNWRDVRGLFFTPCWPALQDTYFSLAALEILGGLDKIDREACIAGILKQHRGKGYFTSPESGGYNEYHIEGDARDTVSAFESLRILNALDRVHDLDQWQFRLPSRSRSDSSAKPRQINWDEVEAWLCQQRFERFLRERNKNPQAPVRSLRVDLDTATDSPW